MSQPIPALQSRMAPLTWGLLLILAMIWGSSFLANRAALEGVGVLTTVAFRVAGGAFFLWVYVFARGIKRPTGLRPVLAFLLMGAFGNALPFSLIVWGQQHINAGLASILNASAAVFGVVIAAVVFSDERLTRHKALGVAVGFAGVIIAIGWESLTTIDPSALGQWAIVAASFSYGVGAALARVLMRGFAPEVSAAGALTGAAVWMIPMMLMVEGVPDFNWPIQSLTGVVWLAFVCSALAYLLYFHILQVAGMANISLVGLLIPPFAIVAGAVVYGERLGMNEITGFVVLTLGLLILRSEKS
ncbi:DMT family transporter [Thioclava sp. A2]|uniref:DMT family transporter n=1 Tax=Thioclava sp. FCG-A2 TaxID=3080562 RepID=UPI0029557164|nr:DMT family transporter [Thioclava sp. A2]MDV7269804.1 DMT family transporter [Thioclava sp. A2]